MAKKKTSRKHHQTVYYNFGGVTHSSTIMNNTNMMNKITQPNVSVDEVYQEALNKFALNGFTGIVITLKNGNAFLDGGINIPTKDGKINNYMAYPVYMNNDKVYDERNNYDGMDCYEYLDMLSKRNPKLRIDLTMSQGIPWNEKITEKLNYLSVRR